MKTFKEIRKGYHRMPDGSIMKDSDHPKGAKKENMSLAPKGKGREAAKKLYKDEKEIDELSIAQQQQRRRNRKNASLQKAMAKYRAAAKAGIHPSKVHQRRTKLTVKK